MPIETLWYIPGKISYLNCYGDVSHDDFRQAVVELNEMIDQSRNLSLHIITDLRRVENAPFTLDELTQIGFPEENYGWNLVIADCDPATTSIFKFMSQTAGTFMGGKLWLLHDFEEAVIFLSEMDNDIAETLRQAS